MTCIQGVSSVIDGNQWITRHDSLLLAPHAIVVGEHVDRARIAREGRLGRSADGGPASEASHSPLSQTITLTQQKDVSSDTTVDGGGLVTLDGNYFACECFWSKRAALSVENLTIATGSRWLLPLRAQVPQHRLEREVC